MEKIHVLMCCSDLETVKGGMVTVVKNYLGYDGWDEIDIRFVPTHRETGKVRLMAYFARACLKMRGMIARGEVDVAHLHMAERGSFFRMAFLTAWFTKLGIPVILHHHGAEFEPFYEALSERNRELVRKTFERASVNLVLSEEIRGNIRKKAPDARIEVLHNAVMPHDEPYCADSNRIIMLGRQGKRKGSYDLLEAFAAVRDSLPAGTELWLCGDGDNEGVARAAEQLHVPLSYNGWIAGKEREECMSKAAVHVLPSYHEGLPMAILETMSRGIPNISTSIASIPEVITDGETGLLLNPGDIPALGDALVRMLNDRELRLKVSENSRQLIRNEFSLDHSVAELKKLYHELSGK